MSLRAAAVLAVLAGYAHETSSRAPVDPGERQRAEFAACRSGTLPPWLDDAALAEAARLDRRAGGAMDPNDSYRPGTVAAQPALPPTSPSGAGSRHEAVLSERREFEARCSLLRSAGEVVPPAPPSGS